MPGAKVSYIAQKHGIPPSQLFYWRKVMENGALTRINTEEAVVPVSEANALKKRIRQLERMPDQKTLDNEILREAARIGREKNCYRVNHCLGWKIWIKGDYPYATGSLFAHHTQSEADEEQADTP